MLANFTEETCTGTGATLALAGATTGNIVFSESFADGDRVPYVAEDSGGTIKVAGVGTYVSATDDITRNDMWNWNGTAIDENPSTNITLSGGTHTVRCAVINDSVQGKFGEHLATSDGDSYHTFINEESKNTAQAIGVADRAVYCPVIVIAPMLITNVVINIGTVDGTSTNTRAGLYRPDGTNGVAGSLIFDSGAFTTSSADLSKVTLSPPQIIMPGKYWTCFVSDSTTLTVKNCLQGDWHGGAANRQAGNAVTPYTETGVTAALPTTATPVINAAENLFTWSWQ